MIGAAYGDMLSPMTGTVGAVCVDVVLFWFATDPLLRCTDCERVSDDDSYADVESLCADVSFVSVGVL